MNIQLFEVGLRDGLQNEPKPLPAPWRAQMALRLIQAGVRRLELGSFVSPRWVPAMASTHEVVQTVNQSLNQSPSGLELYVLVPNRQGLEQAIQLGLQHVSCVHSVTEGFSLKNLNRDLNQLRSEIESLVNQAYKQGIKVRCYLSVVWGCPYEGAVSTDKVVAELCFLAQLPIHEIVLSDTIGAARLGDVWRVLDAVLNFVPAHRLALHFHDSRGQGLVNVYGGYLRGIRTFDGSFGGLGGCPYAPRSSGNLASEEIITLFHSLGIQTGIDLSTLLQAIEDFSQQSQIRPRSRLALAGAWCSW